ncbi:amine oxidase, flavin-containing superfamily [Lindgomyces ingoldianus]|uniref:Amine oxidase, flavin-containing superfamily n=1 Tax=Lindgomyces ingoldianus TaxID=673940 RepID=A0ACB6QZM0_9PLEO|nr:amine oxidase, flavin-containing superfamily [Lindgomyces ingoldianus]KAF2472504.1 amine oxidase, flavin-containing superfamily [Lindgomyces ingoldianus]
MHCCQATIISVFLAWLLPTSAFADNSLTLDPTYFKPADVITRDVAIIGGGSSGIYSAISLKDKGKSIIVVEKKGRIGGHTETYIDSTTGTPIDIGVQTWQNISLVRNYFARLNIPVIKFGSDADPNSPAQLSANYDLRSGKEVNVTAPSAQQVYTAFAAYAEQLKKYPRLNDGMFLPNPVPEDLYMPFGDFVKKYKIEDALVTMFNYNPGLGDVLTVPTVEQMRAFGQNLVEQLSTGFLTTRHHNNSELYTNAEKELLSSSSLLLNSEVIQAERNDGNAKSESGRIKLLVRTPNGTKLIRAKKLLITIPPRLDFLAPFSLSQKEKTVFGKLIDAGYYTSIVKNTGIPDNLSITNMLQSSPYNLPVLPGVYSIGTTQVKGLHIAFYGTPRSSKTFPLSDEDVKADIIASIKRLQRANPDKFNQTEPEFVVYSSHAPFYLQARPEDTKDGFYRELYALQGGRNTYWTGAGFRSQDSSNVWRFSEDVVLPELVKGL